MAKIIGTSGSWEEVQNNLAWADLYPEHPSDISRLLKIENQAYKKIKDEETQTLKTNSAIKTEQLEKFKEQYKSEIEHCKNVTSAEIELAHLEIQLLHAQGGLINRFRNYFKENKVKKRIRLLQKKNKKCQDFAHKEFLSKKKLLEDAQNKQLAEFQNKIRLSQNRIGLLETTLSSPEFAGALAELELIKRLESLPDSFYVLNDVKLSFDKAIQFDNNWLKSAQIDHLVITPAGMFVIEVKNWSREFAENGDFFNPYEQVKRASYLCYKLIGEKYNLKARSILAFNGSIPEKPKDSYEKVLPINKVKGYILWFKEEIISTQDIDMIAKRISF